MVMDLGNAYVQYQRLCYEGLPGIRHHCCRKFESFTIVKRANGWKLPLLVLELFEKHLTDDLTNKK